MLSFLLEENADLNSINNEGDTVVARAIRAGQMENVSYLISVGADIGRTALVCAVFSGNVDMVRFVLSIDNSLLKEVRCGETAHDVAVREELADVIDVLESSEK